MTVFCRKKCEICNVNDTVIRANAGSLLGVAKPDDDIVIIRPGFNSIAFFCLRKTSHRGGWVAFGRKQGITSTPFDI